jgi:hypothetical protein
MTMQRGTMPAAPKRWVRDIDRHGHNSQCPRHEVNNFVYWNDPLTQWEIPCICRELDLDDW